MRQLVNENLSRYPQASRAIQHKHPNDETFATLGVLNRFGQVHHELIEQLRLRVFVGKSLQGFGILTKRNEPPSATATEFIKKRLSYRALKGSREASPHSETRRARTSSGAVGIPRDHGQLSMLTLK